MSIYKCAIYTRVSTEEQAENPEGSIKNQEQRLREYIRLKNFGSTFGEIAEVFSDPGVSAKDMNRPSFQKMLRAIERKEVNLILVTELSRLTRSMKDFSLLQDFFRTHGCEFLSLRENFDSSSATGSLVMSIMATLAEFERKQTAERISNSFFERAKRGLHNGGSIPLGYRVDENKPGSLAVVPDEAELVRLIFSYFLKEETSAKAAKRLNAEKIFPPRKVRGGGSSRERIWQMDSVYNVLRQKAYLGVRVFKDKKGGVLESKAAWDAIVDEDVFGKAQALLKKNRHHKRTHGANRYPYTLTGVVMCKTCGHKLCGKSAHGRKEKIAYYEHAWGTKQISLAQKKEICGSYHRILADRIQPLVWQDVKAFLTNEAFAKALLASAETKPREDNSADLKRLEGLLRKAEKQIEVLAERIAELPQNLDPKAFYDQMARLQKTRDDLAERLLTEKAKSSVTPDEYISLKSLREFTDGLRKRLDQADMESELKTAIIRKIVQRIEILPDGYEIFYHAGVNYYNDELGNPPGSSFCRFGEAKINAADSTRPTSFPKFGKGSDSHLFLRHCSKRLENGGGWRPWAEQFSSTFQKNLSRFSLKY
jgi:DNA invertase Pin-like site-specific DNA recombinase